MIPVTSKVLNRQTYTRPIQASDFESAVPKFFRDGHPFFTNRPKCYELRSVRPTIRRENLIHSDRRKVKNHLFRMGSSNPTPLPRRHKSTQRPQQAREASEISFRSLRHSAVTMLKAAGVSDFIAREIVGHESAAVSRQYTHLTTEDKRAAVQRVARCDRLAKCTQRPNYGCGNRAVPKLTTELINDWLERLVRRWMGIRENLPVVA